MGTQSRAAVGGWALAALGAGRGRRQGVGRSVGGCECRRGRLCAATASISGEWTVDVWSSWTIGFGFGLGYVVEAGERAMGRLGNKIKRWRRRDSQAVMSFIQ